MPKNIGLSDRDSGHVIDDPPFDFVVHIAQRLGIDRAAAQALLYEWLLQYDPKAASSLAIRSATAS